MAEKTDSPMRFDEGHLPAVLRSLAQYYGGITAMARRFGINDGNLNKAINGKRPPPARLLSRLRITVKRSYEFPGVDSDPN